MSGISVERAASRILDHQAEPERRRIRVMIVHPDRLFREALAVALAGQRRTIQVVGWAGAVDLILQKPIAPAQCPDVILLGGTRTVAEILRDSVRLRGLCPHASLLILDRPPVAHNAFVPQGHTIGSDSVSLHTVLQRIQHLGRGRHSPKGRLSGENGSSEIAVEPPPQESSRATIRLTRREQEILILRGQGRSNKEIAAALQIELQTVKNHLRSIFAKAQHTRQRQEGPVTAIPSRPH
jgi:DNA-binding NarL/FixJ family response regulator